MKIFIYGFILMMLLVSMVGCANSKSEEREEAREEAREARKEREEKDENNEKDEEDEKEIEDTEENDVKITNNLTSAYNQAYQENYEPDTIEYITENAKDSYVLLDFSGEDISEDIDKIKMNNNEVSAYISIGTGEEWREDFNEMSPFLVSTQWGEWDGEYFVDTTTTGIVEVMKKRIDKIAEMGFDWVEFDNMDWAYDDDNRDEYGFEVTAEASIEYYRILCEYAHQNGLKCMAKSLTNDIDEFEGVTLESFSDEKNWWDEDELITFIAKDKVVLINHYNENDSDKVYEYYTDIYGDGILFISEDKNTERYKHYTVK